jgi:hypothetical protein
MNTRAAYTITPKGRTLLHSPAIWALTRHTRDLLALCDPRVMVESARQFLPPDSLHAALYSLRELGLIEGPDVKAPGATQARSVN